MAAQRYPLDRSAAFTALLELDRDGFGKQDMRESDKTVSAFLEDWYQADSTNMWDYARQWLERRQEVAQRAPEAEAGVGPGEDPHQELQPVVDYYEHELECWL
jgi:hypothetical protein